MLWGLGERARLPGRHERRGRRQQHAAGRLSVVTSLGYTAFLAGPPFVGLLGNHVGTLRSLLAVLGVAGIGVLMSGILAPRRVGARSATA